MVNERSECSILIIDPVGKKAGLDHYNDNLASSLKKLNCEVKVFSNYKSEYSEPVFKFHFGKSLFFIPSMIISFLKVVKLLKIRKPNVVILHLFKATRSTNLLGKEIKSQKIRLIYILHDVESLIREETNIEELNLSIQLANEIIVHNNFTLEEFAKKFPDAVKKVTVIPHGNFNDLPSEVSKEGARKKLGLNSDIPKVLFFGMIKPSKGIDILLKAMTNVNAQLIVAGRVRSHSYSEKDQGAITLKKSGKLIHDLEYITNDKRDLYFKAADIIVLPYRKIYQSGVMIMAMSYGLPVIASNLKPNLELAEKYDCVEFFSDGNEVELGQKINLLLSDKDRCAQLKINGFNCLKIAHNWDNIANSFKVILDR